MADTKGTESPQSNKSELEARVDAMMDTRPDATAKAAPTAPKASSQAAAPAIDIFADPATAPEVSAELLKEIGASPTPKPAIIADEPPDSHTKLPQSAPLEEAQPTKEATDENTPSSEEPPIPTDFDDPETDKAVDEIAAKEGDALLAAEDAAAKPPQPPEDNGWRAKLHNFFTGKGVLILVVLILAVVLALPVSRYKMLGLIIKKPIAIQVADSKTGVPVSNAVVGLAGIAAKTDANGKVTLKAPIGKHSLSVHKQYFKDYQSDVFVAYHVSAQPKRVTLIATGRQVPLYVSNSITGKPLAGAEIKVLDTTAKTDAGGKATIVLPTTKNSDAATLQLNGYNTAHVTVAVTNQDVASNHFKLTPSGHIYFLSNLSGKIDVVKTSLDGTDRKVVLPGTGKEDANTTLLATRDWRFMALYAKRSGTRAALYLIDTSNDKLTEFDSTDATFNLVGWAGHNFVYNLVSNTVSQAQSNHQVVKSYDADSLQLSQLDQSQAEGSATSYAYQNFSNFYLIDGTVVYTTQWYTYDTTSTTYDISTKSDSIRSAQPGHQGKKDLQSFPANNVSYMQAALYEPKSAHFAIYTNDGKTSYFDYQNGGAQTANNVDQNDLNTTYPTFLLSPSGNQTFWSELRDGKNTLFTGNDNADSKKQIASLSEYAPYGWYNDDYLLVSKNNSELYIMPAGGLNSGGTPLKITDYYKPAHTYTGYGGGYGGL